MSSVIEESRRVDSGLAAVEDELGPPAYRGPGVLIYHGDCMEIMRRLKGMPFSLTVTSPPYNIGKEYETKRTVEEYLSWCGSWSTEILRLTRPNGAFWLNVGYFAVPNRAKAVPIPYLLWDRVPFYLIQEVVWNYGAGVAARKSFSPRNEKFLWYVKNPERYTFNLDAVRDPDVKYPNQKKNGKLKCNPLGKNPTDVWQFPKVTSGASRSSRERTSHPAQFPTAVIDRIIRACSNPGDVIFDPFAGSASTAEAAVASGRSTVGVEIDSRYIDIASKRLDSFFRRRALHDAQIKLL